MLNLRDKINNRIKTLNDIDNTEYLEELKKCILAFIIPANLEPYLNDDKFLEVQKHLMLVYLDFKDFKRMQDFFDTYNEQLQEGVKHSAFLASLIGMVDDKDKNELFTILDTIENYVNKVNNNEKIDQGLVDDDFLIYEIYKYLKNCLSQDIQNRLEDKSNRDRELYLNVENAAKALINNKESDEAYIAALQMLILLFSIFKDIQTIKDIIILINEVYKQNEMPKPVSEVLLMLEDVRLKYNTDDITFGDTIGYLPVISQYLVVGEYHIENNYAEQIKEAIKNYQDILDNVLKENAGYISSGKYNLELIEDKQVKDELCEYILKHNKKKLEEKKSQNNDCINSIDSYDMLAIDSKLDFVFTDNFKSQKPNIAMLKDMLAKLKEYNFDFILSRRSVLEDVLLNSSNEKIEYIYETIKSYPEYRTFLEENSNILTSRYTNFKTNVDYVKKLKRKDISIDMLVVDNQVLKDNINSINYYNLPVVKEFIVSPKATKSFDLFVELGLKDFILNNLEYTAERHQNILKRIMIAKALGMNILEDGKLAKSIEFGTDFFIADADLDKFIINDTNLCIDDKYIQVLENSNSFGYSVTSEYFNTFDMRFRISEYEYAIADVIISRKKVIRQYNILRKAFAQVSDKELIYVALLYNSVLNMEQINLIASLFYNYGTNLILK